MTSDTSNARASSLQLWLTAALITGFFSTLLIRESLYHGALALPPTFDDVSYFVDASHYLSILDTLGFPGLVHTFLSNPPHAPLSTALALLGFTLFGIHNWAGAVIDAFVLFLLSRLYLENARDLPLWQSTLLLTAFILTPFFGLALLWFRPDMFCASIISAGCIYITNRNNWVYDHRAQKIAGIFVGVALWAKPTVFPLTLLLFGTAILLASAGETIALNINRVAKAATRTFAIGALIALPYYAITIRRVLEYIYMVMYGSGADIWVQPLTRLQSILFYLTGYYGRISLGWWLYGGLAIDVVFIALIIYRSRKNEYTAAGKVLAMLGISYLAVTAMTFKGPHGYPFGAMFMTVAAVWSNDIAKYLPRPISSIFCLFVLGFSLYQFQWPYTRSHSFISAEISNARSQLVNDTIKAVGPNVSGKTIFLSTSGNFLNSTILEFAYRKKGIQPPAFTVLHLIGDPNEHERHLAGADIVIAFTPDYGGVIPNLPTATPAFRKQFIEGIEASGLFGSPTRIKDTVDGGSVLIYHNKPLFSHFETIDNLGPLAGPYPLWRLPAVMWGHGATSTLVAKGRPNETSQILIVASTQTPGQSMAVAINGRPQGSIELTGEFRELRFPIVFDSSGRAEIVFTYAKISSNTVLFKALKVD